MGLIDDDKVPWGLEEIVLFVCGELKGADDDGRFLGFKGVGDPCFERLVKVARFEDFGREVELFGEFDTPLLSQGSGHHEEDAPFAFGPKLGEEDAGLDGFSEANFVRENGTVGEGGFEGKKGGLDLVRVEVDFGIGKRSGDFFKTSCGTTSREFVAEVFGLVGSHRSIVAKLLPLGNRIDEEVLFGEVFSNNSMGFVAETGSCELPSVSWLRCLPVNGSGKGPRSLGIDRRDDCRMSNRIWSLFLKEPQGKKNGRKFRDACLSGDSACKKALTCGPSSDVGIVNRWNQGL